MKVFKNPVISGQRDGLTTFLNNRGSVTITTLQASNLKKSEKELFPPLIIGDLEVRLARQESDVIAAQKLRYQIFCEELGARPAANSPAGLDVDDFDPFCDHLLVIDRRTKEVVGTYRMLRRQPAQRAGGFYSKCEYDIAPLLNFPGEILEVGRSCVQMSYRTRPTMQLLWRGIAAYAVLYGIDLIFGCASFPGTDVERLKKPLAYLYHNHLAPLEIRAQALEGQKIDMNLIAPKDLNLSPVEGLNLLPSLIKGYMRVGGFVGDGAVIDHAFNTTDVCIILRMDLVTGRYDKRFMPNDRPQGQNLTRHD